MSEYERARTMPALPEHVFDQVSDVSRLDAWLPAELHVREEQLPAVTVHEDHTGQDASALFRAEKDQQRVEWGTREDGSYAGWLQVSGIGSGASEVTIHLSFFEEAHDPGEEAVHAALDRSLERLAEQVRLRVDDAG
ncbi:SRPBCC family protein [Streptomyces niger]|uniref:SRPBCC family protein n=1 Tax=Streptomyces niger TaxID=66373 RepID=UPI00069C2B04|nr:SRPBCC family protein [Streptomyces niger]